MSRQRVQRLWLEVRHGLAQRVAQALAHELELRNALATAHELSAALRERVSQPVIVRLTLAHALQLPERLLQCSPALALSGPHRAVLLTPLRIHFLGSAAFRVR